MKLVLQSIFVIFQTNIEETHSYKFSFERLRNKILYIIGLETFCQQNYIKLDKTPFVTSRTVSRTKMKDEYLGKLDNITWKLCKYSDSVSRSRTKAGNTSEPE